MSNAIQVPPVAVVAARPPVMKRANPNAVAAAPAGAIEPAKTQTTHAESAQAVQPVVNLQPKTHLTISRDETANTFVYRSIDTNTGDVVWQYPVEQVLRMAHRLRESEGLEPHAVDEKI
jgi:flagellar protein FlaG